MKKLFILFSIFCLLVGVSTYSIASEVLTIKGDVRVEYDNYLSRDEDATGAEESRHERLYLERVMLHFLVDPGNNTTATVIARNDADWRAGSGRENFYLYNAFVKHSIMDNKLAFTFGKFNPNRIPTVYGLCGGHDRSWMEFVKEKKNGVMASYQVMPELNINLALIDDDTANDQKSRTFDIYLNGSYKVIDEVTLYLGLISKPEDNVTNGDNEDDMELDFGVKYKMDKIQATLDYYMQMTNSSEEGDPGFEEMSIIDIGASYMVTDKLKPVLEVEIIDDGNDVDDGNEELNIIVGAHYQITENFAYAVEYTNTSYEDVGTQSVDA